MSVVYEQRLATFLVFNLSLLPFDIFPAGFSSFKLLGIWFRVEAQTLVQFWFIIF